jgi:hypothetical protein
MRDKQGIVIELAARQKVKIIEPEGARVFFAEVPLENVKEGGSRCLGNVQNKQLRH